MSHITLLRPNIWKDQNDITAAVSTSNEDVIKGGKIAGLNMSITIEENAPLVKKHRALVLHAMGLEYSGLATGGQVHSSNIANVTHPVFHPETDGLITSETNLALGILIADCAAVLIADRKNKVIAALHAGWRGAISNIVPDGIEDMIELGALSENMEVYISPCISMKNFEVGEEVAEQFPESCVNRTDYTKPHVDLKKFIHNQLISSGIPEDQITLDNRCTIEDKTLYSYRRQKHKSGRMMAIICQH